MMITAVILITVITWVTVTALVILLFLLGTIKVEGVRDKKYLAVPLARFGSGARQAFDWYLEGETVVSVTSVDEICQWLMTCEYVHDPHLFQQNDFWQHPQDFEQHRRGDCEDHALWAWRKLLELGLEADFIVGNTDTERHAWVTFKHDGKEYLFETTLKYGKMIYHLETMKQRYRPDVGVDCRLRTYQYHDQTVLSSLLTQAKRLIGAGQSGMPLERET